MSKRPFLTVGLASFLSALACSYVSFQAAAACLFGVPLAFAAAALVRRQRVGHLWMAAIGTAAVIAMFLGRTTLLVRPTLSYDGQTIAATVRILEPVADGRPFLTRVEEGDLPKGTKLLVWCDRFSGVPDVGDLVSGEWILSAAFDRASEDGRAAKAAGVYLYAWTKHGVSLRVVDGDDSLTTAERALFGLRGWIRKTLTRFLPASPAGVCRSIVMGDRVALDEEIADAFRASGVYHLLAVSGLHLSVLTGAVLSLLKAAHVRRRLRALLTMAAVVAFMALCGFTASVTRAGVMTCLCLSGSLFRRQADGLNSLGFAAFVMLLIDPFCVWDLGWQLSFAATLGLLTIFPVWQKEVTARCVALKTGSKAAVWLSEATGVSLAASLVTHPLTALYFGEVSTVFLFGNLLCVWAGSFLLIVLFAALLVYPLLPSGAGLLFVAADRLCRYLFFVTEALASLPFALVSVSWYETAWMVALPFVLAAVYGKRGFRAAARAIVWMCALLLVINVVAAVVSRNVVTVSAADSKTPVLLVESSRECGLILSGDRDAWDEAQRLCDKHDVRRVDWLLWLPAAANTASEDGAFSVEVSRLVLAYEVKDASKLPDASQTSVLGEGGTLRTERVEVCVRQEAALLTVGEESMLICPKTTSTQTLPTAWKRPDYLFVCEDIPSDITQIMPKCTVVFGKRTAAEKLTPLLPEGETAYVFAESGWTHRSKV